MRPRISRNVCLVGDVLVEDDDLALLNLLHPRDEPQQRGLADAVRPDHADHDARRNVDADVVERDRRAVPVRYVRDPSDGLAGHFASGVFVSDALSSGAWAAGAVACGALSSAECGRICLRRLGKLDLKVGGPFHVGLGADEAHSAYAGLHPGVELLKDLRIDLQLDAEHQLGAFVLGLHRLWGELRVGRDEADLGRNDVIGDRIEDDARLVADRQSARVCRRQEDRHVDVGEVENGDDRRTGGDDFAGARKLILHASQPRRDEGQIIDDRLDAIDLRLRVRDLGLGLIPLRREALHGRRRRIDSCVCAVRTPAW